MQIGDDKDPLLGRTNRQAFLNSWNGLLAPACARSTKPPMNPRTPLFAWNCCLARYWKTPRLDPALSQKAERLSEIANPHAAKIIDYGLFEDHAYLIEPFIEGKSLRDIIAEEAPLSVERVTSIFLQVSDVLASGHHLGIVHGDLSPENIVISLKLDNMNREIEEVHLLDFGMRILSSDDSSFCSIESSENSGAMAYIAPECGLGEQPDRKSDIYSLAAIIYELLTGVPPQSNSLRAQLRLRQNREQRRKRCHRRNDTASAADFETRAGAF